jgi:hypothetical protein
MTATECVDELTAHYRRLSSTQLRSLYPYNAQSVSTQPRPRFSYAAMLPSTSIAEHQIAAGTSDAVWLAVSSVLAWFGSENNLDAYQKPGKIVMLFLSIENGFIRTSRESVA